MKHPILVSIKLAAAQEVLFVDRRPSASIPAGYRAGRCRLSGMDQPDSVADDARDYSDRIKQLIATSNPDQARLIAAAFRSKVVKCIEGIFASDEGGVEGARSGLGKYASSRTTFDDPRKVLSALRVRDAIAAFNEELPSKMDDFKGNR